MTPKQALISSLLFIAYTLATALTHPPAAAPTPAAEPAAKAGPPPLSDVPIVPSLPHKGRSRAPTNVTWVLERGGGFSVFIRLMKSTDVMNQVENQLAASNGLTILAPTNEAFAAGLRPGQLNELSDHQKIQLVQYHVLPTFVSLDRFETLSNPVQTVASSVYDFPMNVTAEGGWVNVSTGLVNASVSATVFADDQLAVYRVDKVLKPFGVFAPRPKLPPAPAPAPPAKAVAAGNGTEDGGGEGDEGSSKSGGVSGGGGVVSVGVAVVVVGVLVLAG